VTFPEARPARATVGAAGEIELRLVDETGDPIAPTGTVTVTLTRDDGTEALAATTVPATSTGVYRRQVAPALTARVERYQVRWAFTADGAAQTLDTTLEIAGGPLFTIAQARAHELDDEQHAIEYARLLAEDLLEHACSVAFTTRYARARLDGTGRRELLLPAPRVQEVLSCTVDGEPVDVDELVVLEDEGIVHRPASWPAGVRNVDIAYAHGHRTPFPLASRPALLVAERTLTRDRGALSSRATSITNEAGTQLLVVAGVRGMLTDIPEVNAFLREFDHGSPFA
jgi:hypothetical protein